MCHFWVGGVQSQDHLDLESSDWVGLEWIILAKLTVKAVFLARSDWYPATFIEPDAAKKWQFLFASHLVLKCHLKQERDSLSFSRPICLKSAVVSNFKCLLWKLLSLQGWKRMSLLIHDFCLVKWKKSVQRADPYTATFFSPDDVAKWWQFTFF